MVPPLTPDGKRRGVAVGRARLIRPSGRTWAAYRDIAEALFRPIGDGIRWPGYLARHPDTS